MNSTFSAAELLAHEPFVRAIARDLLRDPHAADDVAQDTWLRALLRGPGNALALPGWLARVARNRAADLHRSRARRARREANAAGGSAMEQEAVHVTVQRLGVQRDVVAAVLELAEPYRSVVVLRYYHDLEPTEIAARLGTKASTVRTQLVRAHAQLRGRLDRDHGRAAWLATLTPLVRRRAIGGATPLAVVATGTFLAGLLGVALLLRHPGDPPIPRGEPGMVANTAAVAPGRAAHGAAPDETPARTAVSVPLQEPALNAPEVHAARVWLLDQRSHATYDDAAFSFERAYGGRDRRGKDKARGDYEVAFADGRLRVDVVSDDRSLIVDLGMVPMQDLARRPLDASAELVRVAASRRYVPSDERYRDVESVRAVLGHTYFVWTDDTESDHATLLEVVELRAGEACVLDWYWTEDGSFARGSVQSPAGARSLAAAALSLRATAEQARARQEGPLDLVEPRIVLQARCGAVGGNPCRIDIGRGRSAYFDRVGSELLALDGPIDSHEPALACCLGGRIPAGKRLVITGVTWRGEAHGDSNGRGGFRVQLGDLELVEVESTTEPIRGEWRGRAEFVRGQEDRVFLQISNSSVGEAVFTGVFEPLDDPAAGRTPR